MISLSMNVVKMVINIQSYNFRVLSAWLMYVRVIIFLFDIQYTGVLSVGFFSPFYKWKQFCPGMTVLCSDIIKKINLFRRRFKNYILLQRQVILAL